MQMPKKLLIYILKNGINAEDVKDDYDCYPVSHYDIYNWISFDVHFRI